jgi:outer membrane immunogenic protein
MMSVSKSLTRLLLGVVCTVALTTAVNAADAVVEEAVVLEPGFTWTGLYIGANVGYSWGDFDHEFEADVELIGPFGTSFDGDAEGVTGGVQIGYNWQIGNFVVGIEADAQASDVEGGATQFFDFDLVTIDTEASTKLDWFGTARLRAGFVPTERLLIYGTGGFAFGETTTNASYSVEGLVALSDSLSEKTSRTGWSAGAGAEYAFTDNWTIKGEYLYTDLGEEDVLSIEEDLFAASLNSEVKFHTVRLGVNFHF